MLHLITGGSASGKSLYGERMAVETQKAFRYYLATMRPWGEEGRKRVLRHQEQRAGKGFETMEAYHCLEMRALQTKSRADTVILLECMSNLVANELFEAGGSDEEIARRIQEGIRYLQRCAEIVIVVTNEVFSDGAEYEAETMRYIRLLGQVNQRLASMADQVTEVVYGIAVRIKEGSEER